MFYQKPILNRKCPSPSFQQGVTLVELLVAFVIGLLSIYAVYRVYDGHERTNRIMASVNEAQISGMYAFFLLEHDLQGAGAGIMNFNSSTGGGADIPPSNSAALSDCPDAPLGDDISTSPDNLSLRPLPVVILPVGADFDGISIFLGGSSRHVDTMTVQTLPTTLPGGGTMEVDSPVPFLSGESVVEVNGTTCNLYQIINPITINDDGSSDITITATYQGEAAATPSDGAILVNLGTPLRIFYYVDSAGALQRAIWTPTANGDWEVRRNIVVSNVMFFRAQYGIDTNDDQQIDSWLDAKAPSWDPATVRDASATTIRRIKAIRAAIVVRADEPENSATFNQPTKFIAFDACPGPPDITMTCDPAVPIDYLAETGPGGTTYRYRMYEMIVPLRNTVWTASP